METMMVEVTGVRLPPLVNVFMGKLEKDEIEWDTTPKRSEPRSLRFEVRKLNFETDFTPGRKIGYYSRKKLKWGVVQKIERQGERFFWLSVKGQGVRLRFTGRRPLAVVVR